MDNTEPGPRDARIGPAERPDDPLAAAREKAVRSPLRTLTRAVELTRKPKPPTPDLEGCYYLG